MLESGCVSIKNEVNIMMKNVVDIVLGGEQLKLLSEITLQKLCCRADILDIWICNVVWPK